MRRRFLVSYFASCGVSFVAAQPNPSPKTEPPVESLPPIFTPRTPSKDAVSAGAARPASSPSPPPAGRAISPEMAAKLSAVAARVATPAGATRSADGAATTPPRDSSDAVQLKPYVVREDKLPTFKEREILTPKGMLALARQRYPTALTDAAAMRMLGEDFARERLQELRDYRGLLELGGAKLSPDVKRKIDEAANRPIDLPGDFSPPSRLPK
jgi:hypothetical protein